MDAASGAPAPLPPPPTPAETPRSLSWPVSAQTALTLLLTALLFFLLGRWSQERADGTRPLIVLAGTAPDRPLDLNRATRAELRLLPGVGESLAERIVDHRRQRGQFRSVDELRGVSGVGPKTLDRVRPWLVVGAEAREDLDEETVPPPRPTRSVNPRKQATLTTQIDVNRADASELQKLPGIGPKLSQRIIDERILRGPFKAVDELRRVPGIGPKTLERLRPLVTAGPEKSTLPAAAAVARTAYNE